MQIVLKQKMKRAGGFLVWPSRIMGVTRVLGGILLFALLHNPVQTFGITVLPRQSVTLTWNASTGTNAAGYVVHYGGASGDYTNTINAGNATSTTISGLTAGATYYFAATSYDSSGGQSGFSNEAIYVVPPLAEVHVGSGPAGQFTLTVTGPPGKICEIQATQDFTAWTIIGTVILGAGGALDFTDTNAANFPQRFYRTREIN